MSNTVLRGIHKSDKVSIHDGKILFLDDQAQVQSEKKKEDIVEYKVIKEIKVPNLGSVIGCAAVCAIVGGLFYIGASNMGLDSYYDRGLSSINNFFIPLSVINSAGFGFVGGAVLFGKKTKYQILIKYEDGEKNLIEVDEENFKNLEEIML